jgi:hypothetical protein
MVRHRRARQLFHETVDRRAIGDATERLGWQRDMVGPVALELAFGEFAFAPGQATS